jgi:hypothetical protein
LSLSHYNILSQYFKAIPRIFSLPVSANEEFEEENISAAEVKCIIGALLVKVEIRKASITSKLCKKRTFFLNWKMQVM